MDAGSYMSSELSSIWDAAAATPFHPVVSKDNQFYLALILLIIATFLTTLFALNRSSTTLTFLGFPASVAFGFGAVFMICAVGVYV